MISKLGHSAQISQIRANTGFNKQQASFKGLTIDTNSFLKIAGNAYFSPDSEKSLEGALPGSDLTRLSKELDKENWDAEVSYHKGRFVHDGFKEIHVDINKKDNPEDKQSLILCTGRKELISSSDDGNLPSKLSAVTILARVESLLKDNGFLPKDAK